MSSARPEWNHNIHYFGFVERVAAAKARRSALDVGPGDGMLAASLARSIPSVTGLDLDAHQVEVARAAHGSTCRIGSGAGLMRANPQLRIETVPGSSHFLPMERPDVVQDALLDAVG